MDENKMEEECRLLGCGTVDGILHRHRRVNLKSYKMEENQMNTEAKNSLTP
jgi:hypothetical protein